MGLRLRRACNCGHAKDAHEHYRRGTDCATCDCARFRTHLEVVVSLGRLRPAAVVLPDEVPVPEQPYVRPTHSAGVTVSPEPDLGPLLKHHIARPRDGAQPIPPPVHVAQQRTSKA
jgi:hypothetical protein